MSTDKPLPTPPQLRRRRREVWVGLFVMAGLAGILIVLTTMTDAASFTMTEDEALRLLRQPARDIGEAQRKERKSES